MEAALQQLLAGATSCTKEGPSTKDLDFVRCYKLPVIIALAFLATESIDPLLLAAEEVSCLEVGRAKM